MKRGLGFPILRALGGAFLVLAGLFAYFGVGFGVSAILLLVVGGAIVLVAALMGFRFRPSDVGVFIIGVLVLGAVSAGYSSGPLVVTHSATRAEVGSNSISLVASTDAGSITIGFTDRPNIAYQVNFTRQAWAYSFSGSGTDTISNSTTNGVFDLNLGSTWSAISVVIGRGYHLDLYATTGAGSINLNARGEEALGVVSLQSSTGSVNAIVDSSALQSLELRADTGSVNLASQNLAAAGPSVPITLATSTGSISATITTHDAVSLTASTSLGGISRNLNGFVITQDSRTNLQASAGNLQTAQQSFSITATASVGSVDLNIGFV